MVGLISDFMGGKTAHYDKLKNLHQPVLIVAGDRDPFFPLKNMWIFYRELPNAQLLVYPNAGHGPHLATSAEVAERIESLPGHCLTGSKFSFDRVPLPTRLGQVTNGIT